MRCEIYTQFIDGSSVGALTGVDGSAADEPFYPLVP
ncbi:hypothetical protein HNR12_003783 [Streptomonospora nanhaiensis]|uniref:Uncharacterized protein n=1 Tax=Streptomonospora nanhaiensis TaxID=1323731 RepID=A0A853BS15_9ACTN|nr:hypothetical protein [Streptomonospora nanhaiensis]